MRMRFGAHFRSFGRQIFKLYESYPLTLNSIVGGTVYIGGEITAQVQENSKYKPDSHYNDVGNSNSKGGILERVGSAVYDVRKEVYWYVEVMDWTRARQIGVLGVIENGFFMLAWYKTLSRIFGDGVSTKTVLIKCLCDQIFFATQQDFLFLSLCAYGDRHKLPAALEEVKRTFLPTWLMDCALWPIVNFIGFSAVPYVLQPTYMAAVSFFWQIYLSSVAAKDVDHHAGAETPFRMELRDIFHKIDADHSGYIDGVELNMFIFRRQGKKLSKQQVDAIIKEADDDGDSKISLEDFESAILSRKNKTTNLWRLLHDDCALLSSTQNAIRRFKEFNNNAALVDEAANIEQEETYKRDLETGLRSAAMGLSALSIGSAVRILIFKK